MQGLRALSGATFWFATLAPVVTVAVLVVASRRYQGRSSRTRSGLVAADVLVALCAVGVVVVTLYPVVPYHPGVAAGVQLRPLASISTVLRHSIDASVVVRIVGLNVLLFVPLGFALAVRLGRVPLAIATAAATSLVVETVQAFAPLGRVANVDDVILNTVGATFGAAVAHLGLRMLRAPARADVDASTG